MQTSTVVGMGGSCTCTYVGEGVGTNTQFVYPYAIGIDYCRNTMYVADSLGYRVRSINLATRQTAVLAGTPAGLPAVNGYADGGPGTCLIGSPYGLAVQQATGNVFVADYTGNRIRMVTPGGFCTTIAGNSGTVTTGGVVDGVGTNAKFSSPKGMGFDVLGNLYVADQVNNKIRVISQSGVVTSLTGPPGVAGTATTNGGNGGPLSSATFNSPYGVAIDPRTNILYVVEYTGSAIRNISLPLTTGSGGMQAGAQSACDGTWHNLVTTFSGGGAAPQMVTTFVDGTMTSQGLVSVDVSGSNSTALVVGSSGESSNPSYFAGAVSDVRVFNRALTCGEATALAQPPPLPAFAGTTSSPATMTPGVTSVSFTCVFGWVGATSVYSKNVSGDQSWSFSPAPPSCTQCGPGTYPSNTICQSLSATCVGSPTYTNGGAGLGCCVAPQAVLSASRASCAPTAGSTVGPVDTAFYVSGSAAEGLGGLSISATGIVYTADKYGAGYGATGFAAGGSVLATGTAVISALPAPGAAASVSANVKCSLPSTSNATMTALEWNQPSPSDAGLRYALTVTSTGNAAAYTGTASTITTMTSTTTPALNGPRQGVHDRKGNFWLLNNNANTLVVLNASQAYAPTTVVGSGTLGKTDGVGTNALMYYPSQVLLDKSPPAAQNPPANSH